MTRHSGDYNLELCKVLTPDPDPVFRSWPVLTTLIYRSLDTGEPSPSIRDANERPGRLHGAPRRPLSLLWDGGLVSIVSLNSVLIVIALSTIRRKKTLVYYL